MEVQACQCLSKADGLLQDQVAGRLQPYRSTWTNSDGCFTLSCPLLVRMTESALQVGLQTRGPAQVVFPTINVERLRKLRGCKQQHWHVPTLCTCMPTQSI